MAVVTTSVLYTGVDAGSFSTNVTMTALGTLIVMTHSVSATTPTVTLAGSGMTALSAVSGSGSGETAYANTFYVENLAAGTYALSISGLSGNGLAVAVAAYGGLRPYADNDVAVGNTSSTSITPWVGDTIIGANINSHSELRSDTPSGWTEIADINSGSTHVYRLQVCRKQDTGASAQTWTQPDTVYARTLTLLEIMLPGRTWDVLPVMIG
jgi:hypothetical protein